jgi:HD-like signal output (HDOD) protein
MSVPIQPLPNRVTVADIAQALRYPPCAPKVIPLLRKQLSNLNVPIAEIVALIRLDPGVATRVLQAANSAIFSRGDRCHSVELAVSRIGYDYIFEIVADAVAEQILVRSLTAYGLESDEFWIRSVACGISAEHLARLCGEDVHVAYTLGLLHGVGMVAIDHWAERSASALSFCGQGFPHDYSRSERSLIGCTHAEVGAAVLQSWEFPSEMTEPLRWQFAPLESLGHRRVNCLLYTARWLSARVSARPDQKVPDPDERVLAALRLKLDKLSREIQSVREHLEAVQRRFEAPANGHAA